MELIEKFCLVNRSLLQELMQSYERSAESFKPLSDPLDSRLDLHRQFSSSREEVYSDWLQWTLEQMDSPSSVARVLGSSVLARATNLRAPISVGREVSVEHGYEGQAGRLDLLISQSNRTLAVVEVKTRQYEDADLGKHAGYVKSVNSPEADFILLAVNQPDAQLIGFRFLSWLGVCAELRAYAKARIKLGEIISTALILAFVGAIEHNLLGFEAPKIGSFQIGNIPRLLDHLNKAEELEETWRSEIQGTRI